MLNGRDKHEAELEAIQLIDHAESLVIDGKGEEAIKWFEKAANLYIDLGSYIKLDELYTKIANVISKFKSNIQAVYRLKNVIQKTDSLKLGEISAKLLIQLGNLSYKMLDYETASESWQKASKYLYKTDPKVYYNVSSILLIKASQALEKSRSKIGEGERLIFKAIMKVQKFDEFFNLEEQRALKLISMGEYEASAQKYFDISGYFHDAIRNLEELKSEIDSNDVILNARSLLLHLTAEFKLLAAYCLRASKKTEHNDKIKEFGSSVIDLVKESITLLKEYISQKAPDLGKEEILRITFDAFLITLTQELLGKKVLNSLEFLLENVNETIALKLRDSPFYQLTERIEKVGITDMLDRLKKIHLGHLEKVKDVLISYFT